MRSPYTLGIVAFSAIGFAFAFAAPVQAADRIPKYDDYKVNLYNGPRPNRLHIDRIPRNVPLDDFYNAIRTESPNFAGRYIVKNLPPKQNCTPGAVVDLSTGDMLMLPVDACDWKRQGYAKPFEYHDDSRLLIVAGRHPLAGIIGAHFYEFDGRSFAYLISVLPNGKIFNPFQEDIASLPPSGPLGDRWNNDLEPAAGADTAGNDASASSWPTVWEGANRKPFDFLMLCYMQTAETIKVKMSSALGARFEAYFVTAGGHEEAAKLAMSLCDREIRKLGYFFDESPYTEARYSFLTMSSMMDMQMLANCQSDECKQIAKHVFDEK